MTASDLTSYFGKFAERFLVIEEIEGRMEGLVKGKFRKHRRDLDQYVRLLKPPDRWNRLRLDGCHTAFIKQLKSVSCIRNGLMHFDNRELNPQDLKELHKFLYLTSWSIMSVDR